MPPPPSTLSFIFNFWSFIEWHSGICLDGWIYCRMLFNVAASNWRTQNIPFDECIQLFMWFIISQEMCRSWAGSLRTGIIVRWWRKLIKIPVYPTNSSVHHAMKWYVIVHGMARILIVVMHFYRYKRSLVNAIQSIRYIRSEKTTKYSTFTAPTDSYVFLLFLLLHLFRPAYGHRLILNRMTGPGVLSFIVDEDVQVHVHASNEVPTMIEGDIKEDVFYGTKKEIIFKVTEMVNDQSVQDVPIEYRKCLFAWERANVNFQSMYEFYSHSTCSIECLLQVHMELCNCTHHLMPQTNGMIQILSFFLFCGAVNSIHFQSI